MATPASADSRLPDLRFVPVDSLVPHEQHDERRLKALVQRLREQGVLRNPPVVAPLGAEGQESPRYVVLDGANRATAARSAGLPHMLVQVVRYVEPEVKLSTWYHALADLTPADFERAVSRVSGLEHRPAPHLL